MFYKNELKDQILLFFDAAATNIEKQNNSILIKQFWPFFRIKSWKRPNKLI